MEEAARVWRQQLECSMTARWMCGVSLKDIERSVDLYSLQGIQSG